jgi:Acetoacetate decarboxylase (ADC)
LSPDVYLHQNMPGQSPLYPSGVPYTYRDTEMTIVAFTTDEDKAAALIPKELQLIKIPQLPGQSSAMAIFAKYRENDQIGPYMEMIVNIPVLYKGQLYLYVPYIYVDTDAAMAAGREYGGYPKKIANIQMRSYGALRLSTMSRSSMQEKSADPNFSDIASSSMKKGGQLFSIPLAADKSPQLPFPYNLILPMPAPTGAPQDYVLTTMGLRRIAGVGAGAGGADDSVIAQLITSPWKVSQGAVYAASDISLEFTPSKEDPIAQMVPVNSVLAGVVLRADVMTTAPAEWRIATDLKK